MDTSYDERYIALKAKITGNEFYESGNYSKAFANFLLALNIRSDWVQELKESFSHSLYEFGNTLEKEERFSDLFTCYEEALKICPDSTVILNNLGVHLLRNKHLKEATGYFHQCLSIDALYLPAHRNLEIVSNLLVERWHFRMLNDTNRNECYRRAIQSIVKPGDTVLDIGTGSGLLSLFAAYNNPKMVYACDYSEVMSMLALDVVKDNGLTDTIKVINKSSNDLLIPSDLTERVTLVITETMDAGLLGEGLLQSLDDAWNRLLIPMNSSQKSRQRVIPKQASIFLILIECPSIANKYRYNKFYKDSIVNLKVETKEPYDCEHMKTLDFVKLSEPVEIFNIDFNDHCNIKEHLGGKRNLDIIVNCNKDGRLDSLLVWFNLYLNDVEVISTSPESPLDTCWEQAVFPLGDNIRVYKESKINIKMSTAGGKLCLDECKLVNCNLAVEEYFKVNKEIIISLNRELNFKQYDLIVDKILQKRKELNILELSVYPYIGFKLLENERGKLVSFHLESSNINFLESFAAKYFGNNNEFYKMDRLAEYLRSGRKFDVIIIDLFNSDGELNDALMDLFPIIRISMKEECIIFPNEVTIYCQLVNSEWLDNNTKLTNNSLLTEFKGLNKINNYKITNFIDLDIKKLNHIKMSGALAVAKMNLEDLFRNQLKVFNISTEALINGSINSILYWFSYGDETAFISTLSDDFHQNQVAQMLPETLIVNKGDTLCVTLNYMSCILKFLVESNS